MSAGGVGALDDDALRALVAREFPNLAATTLRIQRGYERISVVAGEIVMRVPLSDAAAQAMERERAVLDRLGGRTKLRLPELVRTADDGSFDAYEAVPGVALDELAWRVMSAGEQARAVADLGRFLAELHTALPAAEARAMGFGGPTWPLAAERILEGLKAAPPGTLAEGMLRFVERVIARREQIVTAHRIGGARTERFLHNDLGGHNLAFDRAERRVVGAFDFGDAAVGDPHQDFQYLTGYGPAALRAALTAYGDASGAELDFDACVVLGAYNALAHVAFAAEEPEGRGLGQKVGWFEDVRRIYREHF